MNQIIHTDFKQFNRQAEVRQAQRTRDMSPLTDDEWAWHVRGNNALHAMGWNHVFLAQRLQISEQTARKLMHGKMPWYPSVVEWLEGCAEAVARALASQPATPAGWVSRDEARTRAEARSQEG